MREADRTGPAVKQGLFRVGAGADTHPLSILNMIGKHKTIGNQRAIAP